jgi:hypothetical protein
MGISSSSLLLLADTSFLNDEVLHDLRPLSVFPRNPGDGAARFSYDGLLARSIRQSAFCSSTAEMVATRLASALQVEPEMISQIVRSLLVTATSVFLDRALRVIHRYLQCRDVGVVVVVADIPSPLPPARHDSLRAVFSSSWHLNQYLVMVVAKSLGMTAIDVVKADDIPEYPRTSHQVNYLASPPCEGVFRIVNKFVNRFFVWWRSHNNTQARYVSLGFSGDDYYLTKRGIYGPFGIFQSGYHLQLVETEVDRNLRDAIHESLTPELASAFASLLMVSTPNELDGDLRESLALAYARFFVDMFPISYLEGFSENYARARAWVERFPGCDLIGADLVGDDGYLIASVVKSTGHRVIGSQHAGHYGYIEDMSLVTEFEYDLYDKMITWGWTLFEDHWPKSQPLVLPAPRLSERAVDGGKLLPLMVEGPYVADVLFVSNLLHRFPHVSTCGQARIDFVDEILSAQSRLVNAITSAGYIVDFKAYNRWTVDFLADYYAGLEISGRGNFRLLEPKQKGLSPRLLSGRRIVLWDQVGTGALDCFTSGIPCLIYWPRIYSKESVFSLAHFVKLAGAGVVHSDADSLLIELSRYLANPVEWMENPARKEAIGEFCRSFALTDKNWASMWRGVLKDAVRH